MFNRILGPLVKQLSFLPSSDIELHAEDQQEQPNSKEDAEGLDAYGRLAIDTLAHMTTSASSDALWKPLHHQVRNCLGSGCLCIQTKWQSKRGFNMGGSRYVAGSACGDSQLQGERTLRPNGARRARGVGLRARRPAPCTRAGASRPHARPIRRGGGPMHLCCSWTTRAG